jgi:hypothetical protein
MRLRYAGRERGRGVAREATAHWCLCQNFKLWLFDD